MPSLLLSCSDAAVTFVINESCIDHSAAAGDRSVPALAPKSLSSPGPTADVFRQDVSEGGLVYSHSISALSNTCTATAGFTSVSIWKGLSWQTYPTCSVPCCEGRKKRGKWIMRFTAVSGWCLLYGSVWNKPVRTRCSERKTTAWRGVVQRAAETGLQEMWGSNMWHW